MTHDCKKPTIAFFFFEFEIVLQFYNIKASNQEISK